MDKILSARVDEHAVTQLDLLARQLKTTKKDVLERAIQAFAESVEQSDQIDVLSATAGAWKRRESVESTVKQAQKSFRQAMERHRR